MKFLALIGIILVSGCITGNIGSSVSEEEYKVYSEVINKAPVVFYIEKLPTPPLPSGEDSNKTNGKIPEPEISPAKISTIVIASKTIPFPREGFDEVLREYSFLDGSKDEIVELKTDLDVGKDKNCIFVKEEQLEKIFSSKNHLAEFLNKYPKSQGLMGLSRVYFNDARDKAVVVLTNSSGPLSGKGVLFFLEKKNGSWTIVREETIWVS